MVEVHALVIVTCGWARVVTARVRRSGRRCISIFLVMVMNLRVLFELVQVVEKLKEPDELDEIDML
jgi:hypothetical protein